MVLIFRVKDSAVVTSGGRARGNGEDLCVGVRTIGSAVLPPVAHRLQSNLHAQARSWFDAEHRGGTDLAEQDPHGHMWSVGPIRNRPRMVEQCWHGCCLRARRVFKTTVLNTLNTTLSIA